MKDKDAVEVKPKNFRFYQIDNEFLQNYEFDAHTVLYYNWLKMWAYTGAPYVSKTQMGKRYKCSRNRFVAAEKALIAANLAAIVGKNETGIPIIDLLDVPKGVPAQMGGAQTDRPPIPHGSTPDLGQNTKKIKKTTKKDELSSSESQCLADMKSLFDKGNLDLYGEKLIYIGKGKEYGNNYKKLIAASGGDFEKLRVRAVELWRRLKQDVFVKGQGFTPSVLLANYNELLPVLPQAGTGGHSAAAKPEPEHIAQKRKAAADKGSVFDSGATG